MRHQQLLPLISLFLILAACTPAAPAAEATITPVTSEVWTQEQIRTFDAADAPSPNTDLTAIYARIREDNLEFRIDLLDTIDASQTFLVALDTEEGGSSTLPGDHPADINWNTLLTISPAVGVQIQTPNSKPRTLEDAELKFLEELDAVTFAIPLKTLPTDLQNIQLQVFSFADALNTPSDQSEPFQLTGQAVAQAPILFEFWNVFPASTPAQALRYWNGAHTGPIGQRHGLFHLLEAASQQEIPVALLDLKTPTALAALDYIENIDHIKNLEQQGLLILPDTAYGSPLAAAQSIWFSRSAAAFHNFPDSPLVYGPIPSDTLSKDVQAVFANTTDPAHIHTANGLRIIPLPTQVYLDSTTSQSNQMQQLSPEGLTLETKRALVNAALSKDETDIVALGGDLRSSLWAEQSVAYNAFKYISGHPWMMPLNEELLLSQPAQKGNLNKIAECDTLVCTPDNSQPFEYQLLQELSRLPENSITDQAWQMFLTLTQPTASADLAALQSNYLGSVGYLIQASKWADKPEEMITCDLDLDRDGSPECVLASQTTFAALEPDGAQLVFLYQITDLGPIQILGPSYQHAIGLSDPRDWRLDQGISSDPYVIPGSFFNAEYPWQPYQTQIIDSGILLSNAERSTKKQFSFTDQGLRIMLQSQYPINTTLTVSTPGSTPNAYNTTTLPGIETKTDPAVFAWTSGEDIFFRITFSGCVPTETITYLDSQPAMVEPEDPNQIFPEGHFLPFPISTVQVQGDTACQILIGIE